MSLMFVLGLLFRWLHIVAAIVAVGGTVFARFVVFPTLAPLPAKERNPLHDAMRLRWTRLVAASIAFLLASGLYNFVTLVMNYHIPRWYHMVFGIKFMLAMAIFSIASLLVGRTMAALAIRQNAKTWMNVNIVLALVVVLLSGVLRTAERIPRQAAGAPAAENAPGPAEQAPAEPAAEPK